MLQLQRHLQCYTRCLVYKNQKNSCTIYRNRPKNSQFKIVLLKLYRLYHSITNHSKFDLRYLLSLQLYNSITVLLFLLEENNQDKSYINFKTTSAKVFNLSLALDTTEYIIKFPVQLYQNLLTFESFICRSFE